MSTSLVPSKSTLSPLTLPRLPSLFSPPPPQLPPKAERSLNLHHIPLSPKQVKAVEAWSCRQHLIDFTTAALNVCREKAISIKHFEDCLDNSSETKNAVYLRVYFQLSNKEIPIERLHADQLKQIWQKQIKPIVESVYESGHNESSEWADSVEAYFKYYPGLPIEQVCHIWETIKTVIEHFHSEESIPHGNPAIATPHSTLSSSSLSSVRPTMIPVRNAPCENFASTRCPSPPSTGSPNSDASSVDSWLKFDGILEL